MVWWPNYILFIVLLVNICSFIVAAQLLEDEVKFHQELNHIVIFFQSEKMVLELSASKWYTWNNKNKKNLLTILSRTGRPLKIKFSENFVVNNRILLFVRQILLFVVVTVKLHFSCFPDMQNCLLDCFSCSQRAVNRTGVLSNLLNNTILYL
jgi:hypothetical protein